MTACRHAVVLLAAGASRRLGQAKQLVVVDGESLVRRAVRAGLATEPAQALIILGAHAAAVEVEVAGLPLMRVECPDWTEGLAASVRAGVQAIDARMDAALFVVCDQPGLTAAHLCSLVARWRADPGRATASAYAGTIGVPAVLPRGWFHELLTLAGDQGARELLRGRRSDVEAIEAPWLVDDVDRPRDLERLARRKNS
jgi:CTP:molybdopterin cytidylyltransferase MocA